MKKVFENFTEFVNGYEEIKVPFSKLNFKDYIRSYGRIQLPIDISRGQYVKNEREFKEWKDTFASRYGTSGTFIVKYPDPKNIFEDPRVEVIGNKKFDEFSKQLSKDMSKYYGGSGGHYTGD